MMNNKQTWRKLGQAESVSSPAISSKWWETTKGERAIKSCRKWKWGFSSREKRKVGQSRGLFFLFWTATPLLPRNWASSLSIRPRKSLNISYTYASSTRSPLSRRRRTTTTRRKGQTGQGVKMKERSGCQESGWWEQMKMNNLRKRKQTQEEVEHEKKERRGDGWRLKKKI